MLDFETGVQVGRALQTLRAHEKRMDGQDHHMQWQDHRITKVEGEMATLRDLLLRSALVAVLAAAGIILNIKAETAGEAAAFFVKGMLK